MNIVEIYQDIPEVLSFDSDDDQDDWSSFLEYAEHLWLKYGVQRWTIEGRNIGWMNRNGYKQVVVDTFFKLLFSIVPDGQSFNANVSFHANKMAIVLYHHDSPTGESYVITPTVQNYVKTSS